MVLLSIEQVTTALGCRCRTVLRMMRRGDLHYVTVGGELYFDPKEIAPVRYFPIGGKICRLVPRASKHHG